MALVDQTSDRRIRVLVFGIMDGTDKRLFIVGESEPIWKQLIWTLTNVLPGMMAMEIWNAELAASGKASLYERMAGMQ